MICRGETSSGTIIEQCPLVRIACCCRTNVRQQVELIIDKIIMSGWFGILMFPLISLATVAYIAAFIFAPPPLKYLNVLNYFSWCNQYPPSQSSARQLEQCVVVYVFVCSPTSICIMYVYLYLYCIVDQCVAVYVSVCFPHELEQPWPKRACEGCACTVSLYLSLSLSLSIYTYTHTYIYIQNRSALAQHLARAPVSLLADHLGERVALPIWQ